MLLLEPLHVCIKLLLSVADQRSYSRHHRVLEIFTQGRLPPCISGIQGGRVVHRRHHGWLRFDWMKDRYPLLLNNCLSGREECLLLLLLLLLLLPICTNSYSCSSWRPADTYFTSLLYSVCQYILFSLLTMIQSCIVMTYYCCVKKQFLIYMKGIVVLLAQNMENLNI